MESDISACVTASGCPTPPPDYDDIHLHQEIPTTPPPPYNAITAPPPYRETDHFQDPNRGGTNPYPVLNMPPQSAMVRQEQMFVQQEVRAVAPQVIVLQPQRALSDIPTPTVCQYCRKSIITNVSYKAGCAAWGMCLLLTVLGLICGFCLIPFCVRGFKDAHHTCPYCHRHLGIYVRK